MFPDHRAQGRRAAQAAQALRDGDFDFVRLVVVRVIVIVRVTVRMVMRMPVTVTLRVIVRRGVRMFLRVGVRVGVVVRRPRFVSVSVLGSGGFGLRCTRTALLGHR
ncbi:MAG: hypothetical protein ACREJ2_19020 [Planctomycetota bacterium]